MRISCRRIPCRRCNTKDGAVEQLAYLCQRCADAGQKIYLFIDEYDNFTNQILANEQHLQRYRTQTHGEGYLRRFFNVIKESAGSSLGRVFVTGVSPVTMDDLTSGFNIGTNYSLSPEFNEMMGFTESFALKHEKKLGGVMKKNARMADRGISKFEC